jgi:hypothetical protein
MDRDQPPDGLRRGDLIWTYSYRAEGEWAAWFNGEWHNYFGVPYKAVGGKECPDYCVATELKEGNKEWWAKIRLNSSKTVWVNMDKEFESFDGVDSLG